MNDEKLANLMSEARLISASDNVIFPLIKKKIEDRISLACGKFAAGETNFISDIAFISGLKEIENDLRAKQKAGNKAIQSIHENNKN